MTIQTHPNNFFKFDLEANECSLLDLEAIDSLPEYKYLFVCDNPEIVDQYTKKFINIISFYLANKEGQKVFSQNKQQKTKTYILTKKPDLELLDTLEFAYWAKTASNKVYTYGDSKTLATDELNESKIKNLATWLKRINDSKIIHNWNVNQFIQAVQIQINIPKPEKTEFSDLVKQGVFREFRVLHETWYRFLENRQIWEPLDTNDVKVFVRQVAMSKLQTEFISGHRLNTLIADIEANCTILSDYSTRWNHLVPFRNGFLNLKTKIFDGSSDRKDYFFRSELPYDFEPIDIQDNINDKQTLQNLLLAHCPTIYKWFLETIENVDVVLVIFLYAFLMIQRIETGILLFFFGGSSAGKSTALEFFDRLFQKDYILTLDSARLNSQFGLGSLVDTDVRLITLRDVAGQPLSNNCTQLLKSMSSPREPIVVERKGKQLVNLNYNGGLIVVSNYDEIFDNDKQGLLNRRVLPIFFKKEFRTDKLNLPETFFPDLEIGKFLALAVHIQTNWAFGSLINSRHDVPEIAETIYEMMADTKGTGVREFVLRHLYYKLGSFIPRGDIGGGQNTLMALYEQFCSKNEITKQQRIKSTRELARNVDNVINSLNWPVKKDARKRFNGVQRRGYLHLAYRVQGDPIDDPDWQNPPEAGDATVLLEPKGPDYAKFLHFIQN